MDVVAAGHICLDIIPDWQNGNISSIQPGRIIEMSGIEFSTGGAVANTGLALHKLGLDVGLMGKVGEDQFGQIIIDYLQKHAFPEITDEMIINDNENTSYTIVLTPPDTDRVFLHYPGTNNTFDSRDIDYNKLEGCKIFHFGYPPLMQNIYQNGGKELKELLKKVQGRGALTSLDMAMPDPESKSGKLDWGTILKNTLPYVDIFIPSIDEIIYMLSGWNLEVDIGHDEEISYIDKLGLISDKLLEWGTRIVVLKLGDQGLYLKSGQMDSLSESDRARFEKIISCEDWTDKELLAPCYSTRVVGTTGSGDSTIAGFLAGMLRGETAENTINIATAVGACNVEAVNATDGIISIDEVIGRIENGWERLAIKGDLSSWNYDSDKGIYIRE